MSTRRSRCSTQGGEDAKIIAGGQSLLPLLRLRLAAPSVLVDVGGVDEMRGVRVDGDDVVIGAMTTHAEVIRDPLVLGDASLLVDATAYGRRPSGAPSRHPRRLAGPRRPGR